jgi:hypothetical protein
VAPSKDHADSTPEFGQPRASFFHLRSHGIQEVLSGTTNMSTSVMPLWRSAWNRAMKPSWSGVLCHTLRHRWWLSLSM